MIFPMLQAIVLQMSFLYSNLYSVVQVATKYIKFTIIIGFDFVRIPSYIKEISPNKEINK
jgi:hypothetical protein